MHLVLAYRDASLSAYANRLEALAAGSGRAILATALNQAGKSIRQRTVDAETGQTGLSHDVIDRAQKTVEASPGSLSFSITSKGGNVRLKHFGAKEGGGGVTAHPWNHSEFYAGAFINSGPKGRRAPSPKLNGQVYRNPMGQWKGKIRLVRSGLFIPDEMIKGQTASAFDGAANTIVLPAIITKLGALI